MAFEQYSVNIRADTTQIHGALTRLDNRMKGLQTRSLTLGRHFQRMFAGFIGVHGVAGAVRQVASFEQKMASVRAVTGANEYQFRAMNDAVREIAQTAPQTADQVAGGMEYLARAGLSANESMQSLESTLKLAEVGMIDVGRAADISTNIMAGFGVEAKDLHEVVDILALASTSANTTISQLGTAMSYVAPIAKSAGVSIQDTTAAIQVLSNAGIQGERAGTGLRKILIELADAGYDVSKDLGGLFADLAEEIDTVSEASDLVGKRAASSLLVLLDGAKAVEDFSEANENAAGTADKMADIMRDNLAGAFKTLQSAVTELILTFADFYDLQGVIESITRGVIYLTENIHILHDAITALGILIIKYFGKNLFSVFKEIAFNARVALNAVIALTHGFIGLAAAMASRNLNNIIFGFKELAILSFRNAASFLLVLGNLALTAGSVVAVLAAFRQTFMESENPAFQRLGVSLQALVDTIQELLKISFPSFESWFEDGDAFFDELALFMADLIDLLRRSLVKLQGLVRSIPAYLNELIAESPVSAALAAGVLTTSFTKNPLVGGLAAGATLLHGTSGETPFGRSQAYSDAIAPMIHQNDLINRNIEDTQRLIRENENLIGVANEAMADPERALWSGIADDAEEAIEANKKLRAELELLKSQIIEIPSELDWIAEETNRQLQKSEENRANIQESVDRKRMLELARQWNEVKSQIEEPINIPMNLLYPSLGAALGEIPHGESQIISDRITQRNRIRDAAAQNQAGADQAMARDLIGYHARKSARLSAEEGTEDAGLTIEEVREQIRQRLEDQRSLIGLTEEQTEVESELLRLRDQYTQVDGVSIEQGEKLAQVHRNEIAAQQALRKELEQSAQINQFYADTLADAFGTVSDTFIDNFSKMHDFMETLEDAFEDFATDVIRQIARMETAALASKAFNYFTGGTAGVGTSILGSLFGFAQGGSFQVGGQGGTDSQLVAFRATPNERVTVETPEQQKRGGRNQPTVINVNYQIEVSGSGDENIANMIEGVLEEKKPQLIEDTLIAQQNAQRNDPGLIRGL